MQKVELREPFESKYMNNLFKTGYDLAAHGYPWSRFPPGYEELGAGPTLTSGSLPADRQSVRLDFKAAANGRNNQKTEQVR
jgi:hypothetical protein